MIKLIIRWLNKKKIKKGLKLHMEWKHTKILPLP